MKQLHIFVISTLYSEYCRCLLDVMSVDMVDMDLYSAEWTSLKDGPSHTDRNHWVFPSYVVRKQVHVVKIMDKIISNSLIF